ncbi:MAG: type II toxin-antitoxin system HicB family antitoxin [Candidatus Melainabacteria bacterium]
MRNMMQYKKQYGTVEYNDDDECFYGRVAFIRDLVSYEGQTVRELKKAFQQAVDDYFDLCREENREPDQPFKGTFNVRTGSELHRKAAAYAESHNTNLNQVIKQALEKFLEAS